MEAASQGLRVAVWVFMVRPRVGLPPSPAQKRWKAPMTQAESWQKFQHELTNATDDISKLRSEITYNDTNAIFFLKRLMSACENTTGCVLLAKADLGSPLEKVARSLFESLISTFWASLSDENANYAKESEANEWMRIIRKNLQEGRAGVIHKKTGTIESDAILNHPKVKGAKAPKQVLKMAEETGLKILYLQIYGPLSVWAHGTAYQPEGKSRVYELMSLVRASLKAIHLIVVNRIREQKQTPLAALEDILKVRLSP